MRPDLQLWWNVLLWWLLACELLFPQKTQPRQELRTGSFLFDPPYSPRAVANLINQSSHTSVPPWQRLAIPEESASGPTVEQRRCPYDARRALANRTRGASAAHYQLPPILDTEPGVSLC